MKLPSSFNPEGKGGETVGTFTPVPDGDYLAQIVGSKIKPTKNNDGEYLELIHKILEGEYKDRQVWVRLNLNNPNQQAVDIANQHLAAICLAIECGEITDSDELHGKPMIITVGIKPAQAQYPASNIIRKWKSVNAAAQEASAQGNAGNAPWA